MLNVQGLAGVCPGCPVLSKIARSCLFNYPPPPPMGPSSSLVHPPTESSAFARVELLALHISVNA